MKNTIKHSINGIMCLAGAVIAFGYAIYLGTGLIEQSEAHVRDLANHLLADAGKTNDQYIQRDISKQRQIAFIIGTVAVAAGFGFAKGVGELAKATRRQPNDN